MYENIEGSARLSVAVIGMWYVMLVTLYQLSELYLKCAFLQSRVQFGDWAAVKLLNRITWRNYLKLFVSADGNDDDNDDDATATTADDYTS